MTSKTTHSPPAVSSLQYHPNVLLSSGSICLTAVTTFPSNHECLSYFSFYNPLSHSGQTLRYSSSFLLPKPISLSLPACFLCVPGFVSPDGTLTWSLRVSRKLLEQASKELMVLSSSNSPKGVTVVQE